MEAFPLGLIKFSRLSDDGEIGAAMRAVLEGQLAMSDGAGNASHTPSRAVCGISRDPRVTAILPDSWKSVAPAEEEDAL